jgi:hypothetical protein
MFQERSGDQTKVRTFVLVSNIPRTATADQLRTCLRDQTTGLMKVLILKTESTQPPNHNDGYALALYDSRPSAVEACDAGLTLPGVVPDTGAPVDVPLTLQAIQHQQVHKLEATYQDTIEIEGEEVRKEDLAPTKGLQMALSSTEGIEAQNTQKVRVTPKWCDRTRLQQDCPRGTSCKFIHKRAHQVTMRPGTGGAAGGPGKRPAAGPPDAKTLEVVTAVASCVPVAYRPAVRVVTLNRLHLLALTSQYEDAPDDVDLDDVRAKMILSIDEAIQDIRRNDADKLPYGVDGTRFFVRLDLPRGTCIDAPFIDASPAVGRGRTLTGPELFNTPISRCASILGRRAGAYYLGPTTNGTKAMDMLSNSGNVRETADAALVRGRESGIAANNTTATLARLIVMPAFRVDPVPYGVVQVFFDKGTVFAALQRDADVLGPVARHNTADDTSALADELATRSTAMTTKIEARVAAWVHRFCVDTKLHLAMAGRGHESLCVTIAFPYLGALVDAWKAGSDIADEKFGRGAVVALSARPLSMAAGSNSLYPPAALPEGEVRWRKMNSVFTQHLAKELQQFLATSV